MASLTLRRARSIALGCAIALPALLAPACSGNPAAGLCRDVCNCEGCSNSEEEDCIEAADEAQADAEDEGCTEEFDAYVECREDGFKCDGDSATFTESCERESADLADCGVSPPTAGNVCDQAAQACGADEGGGGQVECTGVVVCQAQCIVDFDCDLNSTELTNCISGC
jgi:hypothetical protein